MIASAGVPGTLQPADILAAARAAALGPQPVGWRCCGMSARRSEVGGRAQRGRCRMAQIPGRVRGVPEPRNRGESGGRVRAYESRSNVSEGGLRPKPRPE